jgi:predicted nucleotidyltransferase
MTPPEVLEMARRVAVIVRAVTGDPAYRVLLFGSWAAGDARSRSDIDLGIDGPRPLDPGTMLAIRDACDRLPTLYTIDLVDLRAVPPAFREAVTRARSTVEVA